MKARELAAASLFSAGVFLLLFVAYAAAWTLRVMP